jgi:beta-phosphoglucomutase-like phosphatase (HAD superfamily)
MSAGTLTIEREHAMVGPPAPVGRIAARPPRRAVDLDVLRALWRSSLQSADTALRNASHYLAGPELAAHRERLTREYGPTVRLLRELAHDEGAALHYAQPFVPPAEARHLIGLPNGVVACVFSVDGVLVASATVHATAWKTTFHVFFSHRPWPRFGEPLRFDRHIDYFPHLHGRPRHEGVRTFLASRGIRLPEGTPSDPPGADTVHGLANRKAEVFARLLDERGIAAYEGSQRYLELAHDAGIRCATVSASAHGELILERTGLSRLIDERIDANTIAAEHLRGRPRPTACSRPVAASASSPAGPPPSSRASPESQPPAAPASES